MHKHSISFELIQFKLGKPFLNRKKNYRNGANEEGKGFIVKKIGSICGISYVTKPFDVTIKM